MGRENTLVTGRDIFVITTLCVDTGQSADASLF